MSDELLSAWEKVLRRRGNHRAVVEAASGRIATFQELDAGAAAWLDAQTSDPPTLKGHTVVFSAPNGIGWLEIFLGLMKAGAVLAPLDPAEPPATQRRIADSLHAGFWWDGGKLVALTGGKRVRDQTLRVIKLTSGTTGTPRALHFTSGQLLADARQVTATMGITARDLNYALIPFGHSYGLGNLTLPLIAMGVPLVCGASPLPHAMAADFAQWKPTVFPSVPTMWRALAASAVELKSLRLCISAGAPLLPGVARDFATRFDRKLHNFYGSSETGGIAYDRTGQATLNGGVGRALRGVTLTAHPNSRLEVCSAAVFTHRNRRTGKKLGAWLMADAVTLHANGNVALLGRRGQTVKIAGRRVNLTEVAARLRQIKGVHDAWVGISGATDPVLAAVVATPLNAAELRSALHGDTAAWKIPRKWVVMPALPVNARGKIDRRALQSLIAG